MRGYFYEMLGSGRFVGWLGNFSGIVRPIKKNYWIQPTLARFHGIFCFISSLLYSTIKPTSEIHTNLHIPFPIPQQNLNFPSVEWSPFLFNPKQSVTPSKHQHYKFHPILPIDLPKPSISSVLVIFIISFFFIQFRKDNLNLEIWIFNFSINENFIQMYFSFSSFSLSLIYLESICKVKIFYYRCWSRNKKKFLLTIYWFETAFLLKLNCEQWNINF